MIILIFPFLSLNTEACGKPGGFNLIFSELCLQLMFNWVETDA